MKDSKLRSFNYNCKCGYIVKVFLDFGTPQEHYKCRKCGSLMQRKEM